MLLHPVLQLLLDIREVHLLRPGLVLLLCARSPIQHRDELFVELHPTIRLPQTLFLYPATQHFQGGVPTEELVLLFPRRLEEAFEIVSRLPDHRDHRRRHTSRCRRRSLCGSSSIGHGRVACELLLELFEQLVPTINLRDRYHAFLLRDIDRLGFPHRIEKFPDLLVRGLFHVQGRAIWSCRLHVLLVQLRGLHWEGLIISERELEGLHEGEIQQIVLRPVRWRPADRLTGPCCTLRAVLGRSHRRTRGRCGGGHRRGVIGITPGGRLRGSCWLPSFGRGRCRPRHPGLLRARRHLVILLHEARIRHRLASIGPERVLVDV
mmetsp:Transcript_129802/g.277038  ORF Transcript_129802/g.277038 Transcript_129802/m.277038 type:complete len:321 (-) Transcript_129802:651-1613(-)